MFKTEVNRGIYKFYGPPFISCSKNRTPYYPHNTSFEKSNGVLSRADKNIFKKDRGDPANISNIANLGDLANLMDNGDKGRQITTIKGKKGIIGDIGDLALNSYHNHVHYQDR
jgi:hypothetical protein